MTRNTSRIHYIKHLGEKRDHESPGYAPYVEIVEIEVDGRSMHVTQEVIEAAEAFAIAVESFKETA